MLGSILYGAGKHMSLEVNYQKIIDFVLTSGHRLATKAGNIADIGITKRDLTEEDIAIERGFKEIITGFGNDHVLYAEEENDIFQQSNNLWVVDPISGTHQFIQGLPHYSIVVSHLVDHKPVFAAVYDPAVDELYTAYRGKGSYLNGKSIQASEGKQRVILRPSTAWKDPQLVGRTEALLKAYSLENNRDSMAVNYCRVASGKVDGIIAFTKDSFPEFAGSLIIQEAKGRFTNLEGETIIQPNDRIFVAGNHVIYEDLYLIAKEAVLTK